MNTYIHDNSIDGRLSAIAAALASSQTPQDILPDEGRQVSLFGTDVQVQSDETAARRLMQRIRSDISAEAVHHVMYVFLSELPNLDLTLYHYLNEGLIRGKEIDRWHANPHVKKVHDASLKVGREIHRLKGLLRFRELDEGTLWAPVEPDHQVLLPLAHHFRRRLPGERGIIHDMRRNLAVGWDREGVAYVTPPEHFRTSENETAVQQLWQTYFQSATIRERINPRLQRQCMPVRYWKWLTEIM
jgi:probable DNA metabolism protein